MLSDAVQQWLITLGTQNTRTAHFDEDFVLYVGGAKFSATTLRAEVRARGSF
jgi:hypothetical protein